jgi:hypothetical protein
LLLQLSGEASTYSRSVLDAKTTMTSPITDAIREFTDPSAPADDRIRRAQRDADHRGAFLAPAP